MPGRRGARGCGCWKSPSTASAACATYEMPKHPSQRIWVAFAGPMSNLWLFVAAEALLQLPVSDTVAQT